MSAWFEDIDSGTATDTNTIVLFNDDLSGLAFRATEVTVVNSDATNELFVNFRGTVATSSHRRVAAGSTLVFVVPSLTEDGIEGVGIICSTGETATFQTWAIRPDVIPSAR